MNKNTIVRTLSGIAFLGLMLCGLLINKWAFAALMCFVLVCMLVEFYRMTMGSDYRVSQGLAVFAGLTFFVLMFLASAFEQLTMKYVALTFLPMAIIMINSLYAKDKSEFSKFSHLYTGLVYIAVPIALSNLIVFRGGEFSGLLILSFFIIIWSSDVGAFCFGMALGQKYGKKLFPSISPKKSWIGFWGGLLCAVIAAVVMNLTGMLSYPMVHCIILAVLMDVAGVYGDLFESQWKRHFDVKDSGNIIPGHGGMLDRFDSALFAIPVGALYLLIFGLI